MIKYYLSLRVNGVLIIRKSLELNFQRVRDEWAQIWTWTSSAAWGWKNCILSWYLYCYNVIINGGVCCFWIDLVRHNTHSCHTSSLPLHNKLSNKELASRIKDWLLLHITTVDMEVCSNFARLCKCCLLIKRAYFSQLLPTRCN